MQGALDSARLMASSSIQIPYLDTSLFEREGGERREEGRERQKQRERERDRDKERKRERNRNRE